MQIKQFVWNVVDSNSFLVTENRSGFLIDAVDSPDLMKALDGLEELTIILTHCHFDHICGLNRIRETFPFVKVVSTANCSQYIGNANKNMSATAAAFLHFYQGGAQKDTHIDPFTCTPAEETFSESLEQTWQGHILEMKAVHGHSDDSLLMILDRKFLFSGDTLLSIPTVTRFPRGSTRRFRDEDIPWIRGLTGIEMVYPGHGGPGSLEQMLSVNSRCESGGDLN